MMNPWMRKLDAVLADERITADPVKSRFVPRQFFSETFDDFRAQWSAWLHPFRESAAKVYVFVDGTPKMCSGNAGADTDTVMRGLLVSQGYDIEWIVLSDLLGIPCEDLHASADNVEKTRNIVRSCDSGPIVALGSGSITDVVKHAMHLERLPNPFVSIPTALTVTAFTSAFSVIDFHGAKRTQVSREVTATFWIKPVLECAPRRMSRAGFGDLLARFVAYGDWYLGHCLGVMDRYDECAFRLMEPFAAGIRESAGGFARHPLAQETVECASASLAMAGIAMSVSGETTPLSGFEHVISHALDFLRLTSGRELVFHGEQVAVGCLTSSFAIDLLLEKKEIMPVPWPQRSKRDGLVLLNRMIDTAPYFADETPDATLIRLAEERREKARKEFIPEYEKKSDRWDQSGSGRETFISNWPEIREHLSEITIRAEEMIRMAGLAGLPLAPEQTVPPTSMAEYRWAAGFSPFVRSRMNIGDLYFRIGDDPGRLAVFPIPIRQEPF